ncbi:peptidase C39-like protein [Streptomyces sp. BK022]|uniref:cysteine peptidase family C39 domain-containing protein n=1 Tax=Streptomyces sp. BK022 TaxID=2512123 RepID=UPI00102A52E4|nr:cysteine peptidase family C39 domain-containing protein [Streptomyces sp. BK022]RZU45744.1 peptidase C39-like protein [Streptomyces sp. BK022]
MRYEKADVGTVGVLARWNTLIGRLVEEIKVRVVLQERTNDCGPACGVMVLARHGRRVSLESVRQRADLRPDGLSAREILNLLESYGLAGRAVRVAVSNLHRLPPACILFWKQSHFVVLVAANKRRATIIDPAIGRVRLSIAEAERHYGGVAILFQEKKAPSSDAEEGDAEGEISASTNLSGL